MKISERDPADIKAGDDFRLSLLPRADGQDGPYPVWHGWAIMDAFLAGIDHAKAKASPGVGFYKIPGTDQIIPARASLVDEGEGKRSLDVSFGAVGGPEKPDASTVEMCARACDDQRSSKANIVAPLTNAAYDEACRDCAAAVRSLLTGSHEPAEWMKGAAREILAYFEQIALGEKFDIERMVAIIAKHAATSDEAVVPKIPSVGRLASMALRNDHAIFAPAGQEVIPGVSFGPATEQERVQNIRVAIRSMQQLYEEATGQGFYKPEIEEEYASKIPAEALV